MGRGVREEWGGGGGGSCGVKQKSKKNISDI